MKVLATVLLILLAAAQAPAQKTAPVQGDYAEVRSGEVYTCGCLYSSEMVTAGREAILVWRISSGSYSGASLAGIKVAAVVVGNTNLGAYTDARRAALLPAAELQDARHGSTFARIVARRGKQCKRAAQFIDGLNPVWRIILYRGPFSTKASAQPCSGLGWKMMLCVAFSTTQLSARSSVSTCPGPHPA
jgi:hypothetical protein